MEQPLVSVIMPVYNTESYVEQAIRSILDQTYKNVELLVADDASKDNSKSIVDRFASDARVRIFHNEVNRGYLLTVNGLFEKCRGEYITFLDSDDWSDPSRIELLVNEFQKDNALGCAGSFACRVDESGKETVMTFKTDDASIKKDLPEVFNFVGAAIMIRKDVLQTIGPYDIHFNGIGSEHLHWGGKIILRYKTVNVPKPLYYYRNIPQSFSNKNKRSVKGQLSKELAQISLRMLRDEQVDIFEEKNKSLYSEIMAYLEMKYNFWNDHYFTGLSCWFKTIGSSKMKFPDKNQLPLMYTKKWVKGLFA